MSLLTVIIVGNSLILTVIYIIFLNKCPRANLKGFSQGKTPFYSIHYKNGCLTVSNLFHMFTQSIKFYTFYYHVLKSTDILKM